MSSPLETPHARYWRGHGLMYGLDHDALGAYGLFLDVIAADPDCEEATWSRQQIHNLESHWQWTTTIRSVEGKPQIEKVCRMTSEERDD